MPTQNQSALPGGDELGEPAFDRGADAAGLFRQDPDLENAAQTQVGKRFCIDLGAVHPEENRPAPLSDELENGVVAGSGGKAVDEGARKPEGDRGDEGSGMTGPGRLDRMRRVRQWRRLGRMMGRRRRSGVRGGKGGGKRRSPAQAFHRLDRNPPWTFLQEGDPWFEAGLREQGQ